MVYLKENISWKNNISRTGTESTCALVLVVFIDMNTYTLTKSMNFKTFMKENYTIALDNCNLFT